MSYSQVILFLMYKECWSIQEIIRRGKVKTEWNQSLNTVKSFQNAQVPFPLVVTWHSKNLTKKSSLWPVFSDISWGVWFKSYSQSDFFCFSVCWQRGLDKLFCLNWQHIQQCMQMIHYHTINIFLKVIWMEFIHAEYKQIAVKMSLQSHLCLPQNLIFT